MKELTETSMMPWGPHRGKQLKEVPADHLLYLLQQKWISDWPHLYEYLRKNQANLVKKVDTPHNEDITEGYTSYDDYLRDRPS